MNSDTARGLTHDFDGIDLAYGGGVIVHVLSLSVRTEYEHFEIDDKANLASLGVTWTFL